MKENTRVRHISLELMEDGSFNVAGTVENIFVDDEGALVAVKPGGQGVSMRLAPDHVLVSGVVDALITESLAVVARAKEAAEREAEHAKEVAERAVAQAKVLGKRAAAMRGGETE